MNKHRNSSNRRTAAALVEFAVVLPVIFLFFAGVIEVSRLLMLQHSTDTAAYEGARSAMVPGASSEDAKRAARALLTAARLKNATISVTPETITESTSLVTVTVELPVKDNTWLPPIWITSGVLQSSVSLITERPPVIQLTGLPKLKAKSSGGGSKGGL